jgi:hypothetical protein
MRLEIITNKEISEADILPVSEEEEDKEEYKEEGKEEVDINQEMIIPITMEKIEVSNLDLEEEDNIIQDIEVEYIIQNLIW